MSTRSRVDAVRRFNRFWTGRIGVLRRGYLGTRRSLAETRVLFEIGHRDGPSAGEICEELGIDPGYMSRMVSALTREGLVRKTPSPRDGRRTHLALTLRGQKTLADLDERARLDVDRLLAGVPAPAVGRIVEAFSEVRSLLGDQAPGAGEVILRPPAAGDLGWVVHRHGVLYAGERGWGPWFEGLVGGVAARFLAGHDAARERCWIAELDGARVGSVMIVDEGKGTARLRLLLVEPAARGRGIGNRLVDECIAFARGAGYRRIVLWTDADLAGARRLYGRAGFHLVRREDHPYPGGTLRGETWALELGPARR